jgi:hypothetical protein
VRLLTVSGQACDGGWRWPAGSTGVTSKRDCRAAPGPPAQVEGTSAPTLRPRRGRLPSPRLGVAADSLLRLASVLWLTGEGPLAGGARAPGRHGVRQLPENLKSR